MTRRSFVAAINRAARAAERSHRAHVRAQAAQVRAVEREIKLMEKWEREQYIATRSAEVEEDNAQLAEQDKQLKNLLKTGLSRSPSIPFHTLRRQLDEKVFDENPEYFVGEAPKEADFLPPAPGFLATAFGIGIQKHEAKVAAARSAHKAALVTYEAKVEGRRLALAALEAEIAQYNLSVDQFELDVQSAKPEALASYAELVLAASPYPDGFPHDFKVAYVPDSNQLVVDYEFPTLENAVSEFEEFRYAKTTDKITPKKKSDKVRNGLYESAIAQATLRTLHEVFNAGALAPADVVVFSGFVKSIDPATGQKISPYLISVRATRERLKSLELASVDPIPCLRSLNAAVSRSPKDLVAVKPILEFNMVDSRFVAEQDILSSLDSRPNLMELTPGEFESLITNLFQKMGLETKLTQASRDGGVDCVAYDARPILGGKVVVQAKRYRHTVGVSAVRDLFGTMHNEGASKGILVTTSGFGSAAFNFANGKPIELINGANLLYLLREHAEIEAKIEVPPEWVDLEMDVAQADYE